MTSTDHRSPALQVPRQGPRAAPAWWRSRPYAVVLAVYLASRAVSALFIVVAARAQVAVPPSLSSYHQTVTGQVPARYRDVAVNWDAQWYWDIVLHGYPHSAVGPDGLPVQTSLAFYPLYPTVCRVLCQLTGLSFSVVGPTVSLLLGGAAVVVVYRLVARAVGSDRALFVVVLLCTAMASPVLQIAYTESLGLLLVATALHLLQRRRYGWALLAVALLGLTRNITVVLAPVILLHWAVRVHHARRPVQGAAAAAGADGGPDAQAAGPVPHGRLALLFLTALAATAMWPVLVGVIAGDADAYLTTMKAWPGFTSSPLHPPWVQAFADGGPLAWLLGVLLVLAFALVMSRPATRRWGPELWGWTVAYVSYVMLTTGATSSIARYLLLAFPLALVVVPEAAGPAQVTRRRVVVVGLVALGLVAQWFWVREFLVLAGPDFAWLFP